MNLRVWGLLICAALSIGATAHHSHHARSHHASSHQAARQPPLTAEAIDQAQFGQGQSDNAAVIVKAEVLLDRVSRPA